MRFHAIQNVETALRFLRYKEIKLVNIRGEDIVDGNPKLTLGLIWTIILHFQVGRRVRRLRLRRVVGKNPRMKDGRLWGSRREYVKYKAFFLSSFFPPPWENPLAIFSPSVASLP